MNFKNIIEKYGFNHTELIQSLPDLSFHEVFSLFQHIENIIIDANKQEYLKTYNACLDSLNPEDKNAIESVMKKLDDGVPEYYQFLNIIEAYVKGFFEKDTALMVMEHVKTVFAPLQSYRQEPDVVNEAFNNYVWTERYDEAVDFMAVLQRLQTMLLDMVKQNPHMCHTKDIWQKFRQINNLDERMDVYKFPIMSVLI